GTADDPADDRCQQWAAGNPLHAEIRQSGWCIFDVWLADIACDPIGEQLRIAHRNRIGLGQHGIAWAADQLRAGRHWETPALNVPPSWPPPSWHHAVDRTCDLYADGWDSRTYIPQANQALLAAALFVYAVARRGGDTS